MQLVINIYSIFLYSHFAWIASGFGIQGEMKRQMSGKCNDGFYRFCVNSVHLTHTGTEMAHFCICI